MPFPRYNLTKKTYVGLGIYLGFKPSHRRSEMALHGVDYDEVVAELTKVGLIRNGRLFNSEGRFAFNERYPNVLPSQVHMYKHSVDFAENG